MEHIASASRLALGNPPSTPAQILISRFSKSSAINESIPAISQASRKVPFDWFGFAKRWLVWLYGGVKFDSMAPLLLLAAFGAALLYMRRKKRARDGGVIPRTTIDLPASTR